MKFVAIDIGNTNTVVGIYDDNKLVLENRFASRTDNSYKESENDILMILNKSGTGTKEIAGIGISSVVPGITDHYTRSFREYAKIDPLVISAELDIGIKIHYSNPAALGTDRICNAVAGYKKYGGPLIIIDLGTATKYDVVAANGDFLGGVIAPGIGISADGLHRRTAKLPEIDLQFPDNFICTDTESSMQAGILWSALDSLEGMVAHIRNELKESGKKEAIVIATGGFSKLVSSRTQVIKHLEQTLVLDGIKLIYEKVKSNKAV